MMLRIEASAGATQNMRRTNRWFHTIVVTGASLAACGGNEEDLGVVPPVDAASAKDAPVFEAAPIPTDVAPDAGPLVDASPSGDADLVLDSSKPQDAQNDFRCCVITK
jgi:hypothetical protein